MPAEPPDEPRFSIGQIRPFFRAGTADDGREPVPQYEPADGLRPFLITDGRVAGDGTVAIETQVVVTDLGRAWTRDLPGEKRDIVELCSEPLSVAEIAARSSLHLGVVRVLVGDLSAEGVLSVSVPDVAVAADVDTLKRVIRGLRAIR